MIRRLLLLNGVAIIAVILFHSAGWGFVAMNFWTDRYLEVSVPNFDQAGSPDYYFLRLLEQITVFAIPAFLFVSGYFIAFAAGRTGKNVSWSIVWTRIRGLLIPYLIWSLLLILLAALQGKTQSIGGYVRSLVTGSTNPAYYYVPLLIQYYLLSPILVPFARRKWLILLVVTGLIQLSVQLLYYPTLFGWESTTFDSIFDSVPKWLFPTRIFWFTLGVVAGFHIKNLSKVLVRFRRPLLVATIILFFIGVIEWELILKTTGQEWIDHRETLTDSLYSIAFIFSFLAYYASSIPLSRQINELGIRSFGIYLIHSPTMQYTGRIIYNFVPRILAMQILYLLIIAVAGLGIPLTLMAIVNRSPFRGYYKYIFG